MADAPLVSIVVPTYREARNIPSLVERISAALEPCDYQAEILIVDDNSQDGTDTAVAALQPEHNVRLIVRTAERGLSTAVLKGFEEAAGEILLVMDADLQHPPETIPELVEQIRSDRADFAIGSRYVAEGQTVDWPWLRKFTSWFAGALAKPLAPVKDPMSGFFCLRKSTWEHADPLSVVGYKIGLELLIKGRCRRIVEVPITFEKRAAGETKFNFAQVLQYLQHLRRLYLYRFPIGWRLTCWSALALIILGAIYLIMEKRG